MQGPPTHLPNAQLKVLASTQPAGACRAELQREARHYAARPEPVTCGRVDAAPPWLDEPWRAQAGDERAARTDEERIRVEASWGRWLWLVAELAPTGAPQAHPCQTRVRGPGSRAGVRSHGAHAGELASVFGVMVSHIDVALLLRRACQQVHCERTALWVSWVSPSAQWTFLSITATRKCAVGPPM